MESILKSINHRPYPIPSSNWIMSQDWNELLFAHWPCKKEKLANLIPDELELESFEGTAWIGIVPFKMDNVGFRLVPIKSNFLELNVRTYVRYKDFSGVYFFSLDANYLPAVEAARIWFGLPYLKAEMSIKESSNSIHYKSERYDSRASAAKLEVNYRPTGEIFDSNPGSIEHFLTERYCLFSKRNRNLIRGDIHHKKWSLQQAEAEFESNTMLKPLGIDTHEKPLLHYSKSIATVEWAPVVMPIK